MNTQRRMKTFIQHKGMLFSILLVISNILITACNNNDEDNIIRNDIIGSWYGTRSYYNPASGTKYQYLNMKFESNGTGELEYTTPSTFSYAKFNYRLSGSKILCNGYFATDAYEMDKAEKFEMTLSIEEDRLIPLDRYNVFILTKDNSVMTDGEGNEVIDDSNLLNNVWIRDDGYSICVIENGKCTEYMLLSQYGKIYSKKSDYDIYYDPARRTIIFGTTKYDLIALTSSVLEIKSSKNHFVFKAGTTKDIPSSGENGNNSDIDALLKSASFGWKTKDSKYIFRFMDSGVTTYIEHSNRNFGSLGQITMIIEGTYTLNNKQITCYYPDVKWDYGNNQTKDWFPGWMYGKARTRKFTIKSISSTVLTLEDEDGKSYYTTPL